MAAEEKDIQCLLWQGEKMRSAPFQGHKFTDEAGIEWQSFYVVCPGCKELRLVYMAKATGPAETQLVLTAAFTAIHAD